ncbi:MAG: Rrf2 family transcriptional regulator [Chloroflexi bacterium]|nr:Rrf2 family transcriptional regulator [Chloroflexota bacterium]OJV98316.1 MAG: transcriptional regulator [Chloroflexi bacterium 54-19]
MSGNSHFTVALHILTLLAKTGQDDTVITSDGIADSVRTNPVFVRRLLGLLKKGRLVSVQRGSAANWRLSRLPENISLLDVYEAVQAEPLFEMHHSTPNPSCPIGCGIQPALQTFYAQAEAALKQELARSNIGEVLAETLTHKPVSS